MTPRNSWPARFDRSRCRLNKAVARGEGLGSRIVGASLFLATRCKYLATFPGNGDSPLSKRPGARDSGLGRWRLRFSSFPVPSTLPLFPGFDPAFAGSTSFLCLHKETKRRSAAGERAPSGSPSPGTVSGGLAKGRPGPRSAGRHPCRPPFGQFPETAPGLGAFNGGWEVARGEGLGTRRWLRFALHQVPSSLKHQVRERTGGKNQRPSGTKRLALPRSPRRPRPPERGMARAPQGTGWPAGTPASPSSGRRPVDGPRGDKVVGGNPEGARAPGCPSLPTFLGKQESRAQPRSGCATKEPWRGTGIK